MSKTNLLKSPICGENRIKRRRFKDFLGKNSKKKGNFFEFGKFLLYFAA